MFLYVCLTSKVMNIYLQLISQSRDLFLKNHMLSQTVTLNKEIRYTNILRTDNQHQQCLLLLVIRTYMLLSGCGQLRKIEGFSAQLQRELSGSVAVNRYCDWKTWDAASKSNPQTVPALVRVGPSISPSILNKSNPPSTSQPQHAQPNENTAPFPH